MGIVSSDGTGAGREVPPSVAIVETVAAREDVEPTELEVPLYEAIDPEALDRLVRAGSGESSHPTTRIEFAYHGYDVTVTAGGSVHVSGAE